MITLTGLSRKQRVLCDIMWTISTRDGVDDFISTLPATDHRDCRTLIELMVMAFADEVVDTTEAKEVLAQFRI